LVQNHFGPIKGQGIKEKFEIFGNRRMPTCQKLGPLFQNIGVQKLKLSKNTPNPIFLKEKHFQKNSVIFFPSKTQ
jgi:hypothetical protein